jgi:hypothetical protein
MNPNREPSHDESDDALDRAIRASTALPPPVEIKRRVIERAAVFTPSSRALSWCATRRSRFLTAAAAATVAAACVSALLLLPSSSVGWEDVTTAVKSQRWIRATTTWDGKQSTIWLSPERRVWAFLADGWSIFIDGRQQVKYEYRASDKRIAKLALGEQDLQLVAPVDFVSQGLWLFGTERVVSQRRREVRESGKKWIEFDLVFWRGDMSLGTLRVDSETRLPVYLLLRADTDATKSQRYDFTYLSDGPADIYALGIPTGTMIDDRMPPKEALRVLEAIAASRGRIGDFRLVVTTAPGQGSPTDRSGFIVWRKGARWRIDQCVPEAETGPAAKPPDGQGWGDPSIEKLKLSWVGPLYLSDGQTVYENANPEALHEKPQPGAQDAKPVAWRRAAHTAPRDLLSGEGLGNMGGAPYVKIASLVYPDLSPVPGWGFEFEPRPPAASGCVLIKRSARLATDEPKVGHEWYYLDPNKGYGVVRAELFTLPADAPTDPKAAPVRQTFFLEDFQQSPQGFWYPNVIHDIAWRRPPANQKAGPEVRDRTSTTHYLFDFTVALPDRLFVIDEASNSRK